eukprot:2380565-Amphidinium_carterae.1
MPFLDRMGDVARPTDHSAPLVSGSSTALASRMRSQWLHQPLDLFRVLRPSVVDGRELSWLASTTLAPARSCEAASMT